ncbi:hypothetical protein HC752_23265 [Vibrio sp. S9_S30]|uniref:hypothetical protein n=1 Tax=Vibrio sp. S9_S30 TaxID=2720226 RepID=UPI0016804AF1|nr:hypothetical protein [Vibrio sp. S9_S30]MBD1559852.1 hypothetical protein [Vibrio sp. S9_S30]
MKSIIKGFFIGASLLSVIACQSTSSDKYVHEVFGQKMIIEGEFLQELRDKWVINVPIIKSNQLRDSDIQWALDNISMAEGMNSAGCDSLVMIETRDFDSNTDVNQPKQKVSVGQFDYAWVYEACGEKHITRVVHDNNSNSMAVYPTWL